MLDCSLSYIGDLHFVLPEQNLSIFDAGILTMVQQGRLMMLTHKVLETAQVLGLLLDFDAEREGLRTYFGLGLWTRTCQ